ncbi:TetR/AcrR family transcriptional regulator [Streptomyces sp. CBMA156]|uniref:TetR/AcrR family transcriptional regulator n=1 Tax=Streptomyces sp. CBMA156 TaxID=1930280 RepID=UPI001661FA35|nr:TetR/AcrR family transcriptional regulator [Streptomyces sp. CBMA156]MBD0670800.1 TetR family transcriptional regulator [Streptomyces sp. CBMA156]MBD0674393.1 TetR family transcriptional regulator [Streptomyces sp. CBMA156]
MDQEDPRTRILDAAEELFYGQGVQAVGMDAVRAASGLTMRRLYQHFPSKGELVEAYLLRRDGRWRASLAVYVSRAGGTPGEQLLAVFDWLGRWFAEPGFRGCAFVNSLGELGASSPAVVAAARHHKEQFGSYLAGLTEAAGAPPATAVHLALLAEGAITSAAVHGDPTAAADAREAARLLLDATTPAR